MAIQVGGTTVIDNSKNYSGGGVSSSSFYRIANPGGAEYISTAGALTGALQITLPVGFTNTMMRMTVKVYLYSTNQSFDVICGGYNYFNNPAAGQASTWINTFAYAIGNPSAELFFNVRFGVTAAGKSCIYIGELSTVWPYPQFYVSDVQLGYSGISPDGGITSPWVSGWSANIQASAFENVTSTIAAWGRVVAPDRQTGSLLTGTGSLGGIELRSSGLIYTSPGVLAASSLQPAAFMTFHRPGAFAGYFGLDNDNNFAIGGWSYSATNPTTSLGNFKVGSFGVGTPASGTNGEIRATSNITAYYSDKRLKYNIHIIDNALNKVNQISGVTFQSNEEAAKYGYTDTKTQVGVIAQEIEAVLPEAVVPAPFDIGKNEDGTEYSKSGQNYMTVRYEKIVPLLIEAIKELKAELDAIKEKIK